MNRKIAGIRGMALAASSALLACSFVRHASYTVEGEPNQTLLATPEIQVKLAGVHKENYYPFTMSPVRLPGRYQLTLNISSQKEFIVDSLYVSLAESDSLGGKIREVSPKRIRTEIVNAYDCETVVHEGLVDDKGEVKTRMGGIDAHKYVANFPGMKKFNLYDCLISGESTKRAPKLSVTYQFGEIKSPTAVLSALVWLSVGGKPTYYSQDFVLHKKVDWNVQGVLASN